MHIIPSQLLWLSLPFTVSFLDPLSRRKLAPPPGNLTNSNLVGRDILNCTEGDEGIEIYQSLSSHQVVLLTRLHSLGKPSDKAPAAAWLCPRIAARAFQPDRQTLFYVAGVRFDAPTSTLQWNLFCLAVDAGHILARLV